MSDKYETRVTRVTVLPEDEPVFSERATHVEIEDEASGEWVKVRQEGGHTDNSKFVLFGDKDEWDAVKKVVESMFKEIENRDGRKKALVK